MTAPTLPDAHVAAQASLADRLGPLVASIVAEINPSDLAGSKRRVAQQMRALRFRYGRAAVALAVAQYRQIRAASVPGSIRLSLPDPAAVDVDEAVGWAMRDLWGPLNDEPVTVDGKTYQPFPDRLTDAQTNLTGVADKLVLDEGRNATLSFVQQDRKARGWARVPEPDCCAFCALLSTRGAVYKEDTVKFNRTGKFYDTTEFGAHDHCRCQPEPVFFNYQKSAQILAWESLYSDSIEYRRAERPVSRTTGEPMDGMSAFRKLYDQQRTTTAG